MPEWTIKKLNEIADFNPKETIAKGSVAKKIPMDKLQPYCRDVPYYVMEKFSGGTKFRNGDTIMARITPCLENGKTALVNVLNEMKSVLARQNILFLEQKTMLIRIIYIISFVVHR